MANKTKQTSRRKTSAARKAGRTVISKHPLFCVFVTKPDGTEEIVKKFLLPLQASQYVAGYNSGQAINGYWAEAREVDLDSIRFVGTLTQDHVFEHVASFRKNLGQPVATESDS